MKQRQASALLEVTLFISLRSPAPAFTPSPSA
jgi:hypothetical protein